MSRQAALAEWVARLDSEAIPNRVMQKAQQLLLDTIGVALAGSRHVAGQRMSKVVESLAGKPHSSILGTDQRTSAIHAALANAYFAHVLDFDDTHLDVYVHVNSPVLGAALAVAEQSASSGRDFITAYVAGLEITSRVGLCARNQLQYPWHWDGIAGVFGATAASGRLLSLSADAMTRAFGIASQLASGIRAHKGTMTKALSPANAAANGVLAAIAAQTEITSSDNALEHIEGFFAAHGESDLSQLVTGLGESYRLLDSEPKPYPCGVIIHPAIDAALDLHARGLRADELTSVHVFVNPVAMEVTGERHPPDGLRSKFSVFHGVAAALLDGGVELSHFEDDYVNSHAAASLRSRIMCFATNDVPPDEARVLASTSRGEHVRTQARARGSRHRRMSTSEIERKFISLAVPVLGADAAEQIVSVVGDAMNVRAIADLVQLCVPSTRGHEPLTRSHEVPAGQVGTSS